MNKYTDCTRMVNGHPWSPLDECLLSEMEPEEQTQVKTWIVENVRPRKTAMYSKTSYGLKHLMEYDNGLYVTNNQFKDAMLECGYEPVNPEELNWCFRISKKSPCFACRR